MTTALLWYRRDLRIADHPALTRAAREFRRVVPVFVLDDALLRGRFASGPRAAFMLAACVRWTTSCASAAAGSSCATDRLTASLRRSPARCAPKRFCGRAMSHRTRGCETRG